MRDTFGSRVFLFFSLSAREVGHNFSLSASLKRRRFRYRGGVGIPLALGVAITISSTPLLNCCSFLNIAWLNRSLLRRLPALDDLRDLSRPNTIYRASKRIYVSSVPFDLPRMLLEPPSGNDAHFLHVSFRTFPHV